MKSDLNQDIEKHQRAMDISGDREEGPRVLLNAAVDTALLIDTEGNILTVSTAAAERLGKTENELIGMCVYELSPPVEAESRREQVARVIRTGEPVRREDEREGKIMLESVYPVFDRQGKVERLAVFGRDITDHKQTEEALNQLNRQLETSIERVNILNQEVTVSNYALNSRVRELDCLYSLSNVMEKSDISLEEMFQKIAELIPDGYQFPDNTCTRIVFQGRDFKSKRFQETPWKMASDIIYQGEKTGVVEVFRFEVTKLGGEGAFLKEEKQLLIDIAKRLGLITTHKQTDAVIKATNDFLESVMESITNAIYVIDLEGKFSLVSRVGSEIAGYTVDEMIDRSFSMLFEPDVFEEVNKRFLKAKVLGAALAQYEVKIVRKDGNKVMVSLGFAPLYEEGKIVSVVGTAEDITGRKELERKLQQAQKLESIGQLASGVAHEINTPTQYIGDNTRFLQESFRDINKLIERQNRFLEAAKKESVSPELISRVEEFVEEIDIEYLLDEIPRAIQQTLEGVDRVSEIVSAMKEFSHPGVEGKTAIDINKAIESTLTVSRNEWKYVAEIEADLDPDLPLVPCLPGEFSQVIINMVINATHAIAEVVGGGSKGKGTIKISTRRGGEWVEIRLGDSGTGIPEEIRSKIFDPFYTTKGVGKGSGQGLAISRSIIADKHGGTIDFETEMGRGTTFIIRLPVSSEASNQESN